MKAAGAGAIGWYLIRLIHVFFRLVLFVIPEWFAISSMKLHYARRQLYPASLTIVQERSNQYYGDATEANWCQMEAGECVVTISGQHMAEVKKDFVLIS